MGLKELKAFGDLMHDLACNHDAIGRDESIYSRALKAIGDYQADAARLRGTIVKLRDALEPFARQADIIDGNDKADGNGPEDDAIGFRFRGSYAAICLGDCRRAKSAAENA